jgi:hypothetical protein
LESGGRLSWHAQRGEAAAIIVSATTAAASASASASAPRAPQASRSLRPGTVLRPLTRAPQAVPHSGNPSVVDAVVGMGFNKEVAEKVASQVDGIEALRLLIDAIPASQSTVEGAIGMVERMFNMPATELRVAARTMVSPAAGLLSSPPLANPEVRCLRRICSAASHTRRLQDAAALRAREAAVVAREARLCGSTLCAAVDALLPQAAAAKDMRHRLDQVKKLEHAQQYVVVNDKFKKALATATDARSGATAANQAYVRATKQWNEARDIQAGLPDDDKSVLDQLVRNWCFPLLAYSDSLHLHVADGHAHHGHECRKDCRGRCGRSGR